MSSARGLDGRRRDRDVSMRDEPVFGVTNSRYHASPSSDRRRCNDLTLQRITTGSPLYHKPLLARRGEWRAKNFGPGDNHGDQALNYRLSTTAPIQKYRPRFFVALTVVPMYDSF